MNKRVEKTTEWLDERLGIAKGGRSSLNKIFPDHWSFMLGEIALYSFIVLLFTGVFLTLFYVPSTQQIIYHGSYAPLRGQSMSEAYASTLHISFSVRAGLVMRQMHHWAANIFIAAIVVHLCRVFFTGSFRKPREINWIIGSILLILAIVNGFIGYSLPDDLISGTGIRIAFSIVESVPLVGSYLAFFLFGGNYPGNAIIPRFYTIHVLLVPALIVGLLAAHLGIMYHQKHTQYPAPKRTNKNVVGTVFWPTYALEAGGFFFITAAVIAALGGLVQINPIWLYGPYVPYKVSYAVQPDWYMGWLDGALRLMPSWEVVGFGHMIPNVFFPAVLLPGLTFTALSLWPFIEKKITKDDEVHNLCDRPRDNPWRTSLGVGILTFYIVLFFASSTDVLANTFNTSLNLVLWTFRVLLIALPPLAGYVTYMLTKETEVVEEAGSRRPPVVITRSLDGEYHSVPVAGDEAGGVVKEEFEPMEVPEEKEYESFMGGVASEHRDKDLVGVGESSSKGGGSAFHDEIGPSRSGGSGIFRVPRNLPGSGGLFGGRGSRRQRRRGGQDRQ
jgi:ubiquinol-cytochrome c reductase cytochrome b subunit